MYYHLVFATYISIYRLSLEYMSKRQQLLLLEREIEICMDRMQILLISY